MKKQLFVLCLLVVLSYRLVAHDDMDERIGSTRALVGNQNTSVLHGHYVWKSQGFTSPDHLPFVEAGQMYFDGAGRHWGSSTINVDGSPHYHICPIWCGGTYNVNDRFEGTFIAARRFRDSCNLEVTVDGSMAYCVSTDATSTWIMEFTRRGD